VFICGPKRFSVELPARDAETERHICPNKIPNPQNGPTLAAYCAGFIEIDPISRVSAVTQLICRSYPLGVPVWKLW